MSEVWLPVPGYALYEVSSLGRVRYAADALEVKARSSSGYRKVRLYSNDRGERSSVGVHVLVALAFVGPKPFEKAVCRHVDHNRSNNIPSNLVWGSQAENIDDTIRAGNGNHGASNGSAVLSEADVTRILELCSEKLLTQKQIASMFGVHHLTVSKINRGSRWSRVTGVSDPNARRFKKHRK